uniref:Uncharacterized protein n=1 Tax=Oryza punctata TaxID=4537 RepID=A0A0E0M5X5_ORYPU
MVVCSPWNMSYNSRVSRVLTKQGNRGSKVQGVAETVVVGKRRQNSGVNVGWSAARSVTPTTCSTDCS